MFDLGLTSEQFWALTPAQLAEMRKRYERRIERSEFGPALICLTIAQALGVKDRTVYDWMPSKAKGHNENKAASDLRAKVLALAKFYGGAIQNAGR